MSDQKTWYHVTVFFLSSAKELLKERKKIDEDTFIIETLFWGFIRLFCSEEMSFWTIRKQSRLPNKALKYIRHFRWVIHPKSVVMSSRVFFLIYVSRDDCYWCATKWTCFFFSASSRRKEVGLSSSSGHCEMRRQSHFTAGEASFFKHAPFLLLGFNFFF